MNTKQIWISNGGLVRAAPLDGRPHGPDDSDESLWQGKAVGHWEGDTLVLDSTGFNDISWFSWTGFFHSDRMQVVERFRRDGDLLFYTYTVIDPVVLQEPYTSRAMVWKLSTNPDAVLEEPLTCEATGLDDQIEDPYFRA